MTTPARKRLMWDFKRLQKDPPVGISGAPQDNNIMHWNAVIFGYNIFVFLLYVFVSNHGCLNELTPLSLCRPDDSPWDGGIIFLRTDIFS